jgi:hypothetical protein
MTTLLLLGPWTPMLFQGEEFAASTPFLYFADQPEEIATKTAQGRAEFLKQFPSMASPEVARQLPRRSNDSFQRTVHNCRILGDSLQKLSKGSLRRTGAPCKCDWTIKPLGDDLNDSFQTGVRDIFQRRAAASAPWLGQIAFALGSVSGSRSIQITGASLPDPRPYV